MPPAWPANVSAITLAAGSAPLTPVTTSSRAATASPSARAASSGIGSTYIG